MDTTLVVVTGVLVVATLLPLWRNPHWLVRSMDFPRMQLAVIAALLLLLQLASYALSGDLSDGLGWGLMAITGLCLAWQLWWILPYTKLWRVEVRGCGREDVDRQLSILTSNVLTTNRHSEKLIALVNAYQPDVLVTLESDQWWEDQLACLEAAMPYTLKCPLDNLYGMHVYSRLPLYEKEVAFLVEADIPSMHALLELPTGERIRVHFLHPAPPSPTENPESAERDAELVIVARSVKDSELPVIVSGDLNDVAWSRTTRLFRKLSGLLDPRVGRGMFNTFHVSYPLLRWPLDHLFHSKHFSVQRIRRLTSIGSDHFPLYIRLGFTPVAGQDQQGLTADADDRALAAAMAADKAVEKEDVPTPGA